MKKLKLSKGTLAYQENEGDGHPVVYVHGNSASSKAFQKQLADTRLKVYALDLPGHGESEHLNDPSEYNIPMYAKIVSEFATELGLESAVFVGWSLGGHVVLEAVKFLPKAKGFVIYGTPPISFPPSQDAFFPDPVINVGFTPEITEEMARSYGNAFFQDGTNCPQSFVDDILNTDGNARAGLAMSMVPGGFEDEVSIVASMKAPLAILHGSKESLVNPAYISSLNIPKLWRGEIQMIEKAGHATNWENPEAFNDIINEFVNEVS